MAYSHGLLVTPLGEMHAFASDRGLRALIFDGGDSAAYGVQGEVREDGGHAVIRSCAAQLESYFDGGRRSFDLRLDAAGTEFQAQAWRALRQIPYGQTWSYAQQAASFGRPSAARAVGAANARNPLMIVTPCHRVIGARGAISGFAGGVARKQALLNLERTSGASADG